MTDDDPQQQTISGPAAPPPGQPFWGYSDVAIFIGAALPCMLLGFLMTRALLWLLGISKPARAAELVAAQSVGYLLLACALALLFRAQYRRPFWRSLGWVHPGWSDLRSVFLGLVTAFGVAIVAFLIGTPTTSNPMLELLRDRKSIILVAFFGVTIGPLFEELVFRGFLQPLLERSFGTVAGIIAASLPFGLLHFQEYGNSWRHVLVISLAGTMFGWVRHVTGSTRASTVMHASYNALFFLALLTQGKVDG